VTAMTTYAEVRTQVPEKSEFTGRARALTMRESEPGSFDSVGAIG
jgi:hypothetical protein